MVRSQAKAMDVGKLIQDQTWLIRSQGRFQRYMDAWWRLGISVQVLRLCYKAFWDLFGGYRSHASKHLAGF